MDNQTPFDRLDAETQRALIDDCVFESLRGGRDGATDWECERFYRSLDEHHLQLHVRSITMNKERKIYPRRVITYNAPHSDGDTPVEIDNELYLETVRTKKVGDLVVAHAGAPGTGRLVERITRIADDAIYGVVVEDTIRDLKPWEVQ